MPRQPFDPTKSINPLYWTRRKYYEKHRQQFLEYGRKYQQSHRKEAVKATMKWRKKHRLEVNAYSRQYSRNRFRSNPVFREKERQRGLRKYRQFRARYLLRCAKLKHTLEAKARQKLNDAVRHKRIIRPSTCEACGVKDKIQGHHHRGYSRPFDVIWLCKLCHESLHHP